MQESNLNCNYWEERCLLLVSRWTWMPFSLHVTLVLILGFLFSFYYRFLESFERAETKQARLIKKSTIKVGHNMVAIVTGANSGIGYETAKLLVSFGYKVIIGNSNDASQLKLQTACRDKKKALQAIDSIKINSSGPCDIEFQLLDLASFDSVRQFVKEFSQKNIQLDLLVNNGGVALVPRLKLTENGFETQFQVNYLSHFLLTRLLLPQLKNTPHSKVINVSSLTHYSAGEFSFAQFNVESTYSPLKGYVWSKAALIMSTFSLRKILSKHDIQVFSIHPGIVSTNLFQNIAFGKAILKTIIPMIFKSSQQAALGILNLALLPPCHPHESFAYFSDTLPMKPSSLVQNKSCQDQFYKDTCCALRIDYMS